MHHDLHDADRPVFLSFDGLEMRAFSISGLASYVAVPSFDACFDLGHCSVESSHLRNVLLSHVHQDHSLGVVRHLSLRAMTGASPSRIFVPEESREPLVRMLRAYDELEGKELRDLDAIVHGVRVGETFALSPNRSVHAFDVTHRIASRGYTVTETRRKLKEHFLGLPGEAIRDARERGEELYDYHDVNLFTYIGDSTVETLERHPEVGRSAVLFLEATHLPGTSPEVSAKYGHTHLDELVELHGRRPEALASAHVVIKHFSMKYRKHDILAAHAALPDGLRERVTFLVR
jgi:ribonuclease BN (tRNA processing enzyme)